MNPPARKPIHSCLILLLCTAGGILLAFIAAWIYSIPEPFEPPSRLPPSPSKAKTILGTRYQGFSSSLIIQAMDGKSYQFNGGRWNIATEPSEGEEDRLGPECLPREVQFIEATAGKINDCRLLQPITEMCPRDVAYAVTPNGDVWELLIDEWCPFGFIALTIRFFIILIPAGLALGIIVVITRQKIANKRIQSQNGTLQT